MLKKVAVLAAILLIAFTVMLPATRSSRFAVETAVQISQPAAAVWGVLAAVPQWPAWWPGVAAARLSPGWQEGAALELVLQGNPERSPARITAFEPLQEMAWTRGGVLGSTTRTRVRLQPDAGGTLVRMESSIRGPQAFFARLTGRGEFEKYHQAVLAGLQRQLLPVPSASQPTESSRQ
jgi:hypothetical protein